MAYQFTERVSKLVPKYPNSILQYRIQAGLSQHKLGALLGRSRSAVSIWERSLRFPGQGLVLRLAKRLNTLVETLYYEIYYEIYAAEQYFEDEVASCPHDAARVAHLSHYAAALTRATMNFGRSLSSFGNAIHASFFNQVRTSSLMAYQGREEVRIS